MAESDEGEFGEAGSDEGEFDAGTGGVGCPFASEDAVEGLAGAVEAVGEGLEVVGGVRSGKSEDLGVSFPAGPSGVEGAVESELGIVDEGLAGAFEGSEVDAAAWGHGALARVALSAAQLRAYFAESGGETVAESGAVRHAAAGYVYDRCY